MPVAPAIPQYTNLHRDLPEDQLHEPKGFTTAGYDSFVTKSIHGENVWQSMLFQQPVIGFLSLGSSVSPSNGDRYIAIGVGSTGEYAGAVADDIIGYLTLDSNGNAYNQWDKIPPAEGMLTYITSLEAYYYYNGSAWLPLGTGGGGGNNPNDTTVTFIGSNLDTYLDLYSPTAGLEIDRITYVVNTLDPSDDSTFVRLVFHDGNPSNDVEIISDINTNLLNETKKQGFDINAVEIPSGFTMKLFVSGSDINSGTLRVITYFLP